MNERGLGGHAFDLTELQGAFHVPVEGGWVVVGLHNNLLETAS
jgi:hypothetical protein